MLCGRLISWLAGDKQQQQQQQRKEKLQRFFITATANEERKKMEMENWLRFLHFLHARDAIISSTFPFLSKAAATLVMRLEKWKGFIIIMILLVILMSIIFVSILFLCLQATTGKCEYLNVPKHPQVR